MRIASIDIGSYSVRLTVAEVKRKGINILLEKGYITSLASGLEEDGLLKEDRVKETLRVLKEYKSDIERLKVDKVIAVATEALRKAKNSKDFIGKVKKYTGIKVRIITPEEEGRLAYTSAVLSLEPEGITLVVDQGGGSTEMIFGRSIRIDDIVSLPIGIVNLTEKFLPSDPPTDEEIKSLMQYLGERIEPLKRDVDVVVGLGGTITTVTALEFNVYPYRSEEIHGRKLSRDVLSKWFSILVELPYRERSRRFKQIEDRRARVIVAGIAMFIKILDVFKKDHLIVSDWGVKHGLILKEAMS